jgi:hypothetical protein
VKPDASISETVSANRPRRGRKAKFKEKGYEMIAELGLPATVSDRTRQNYIYAYLAGNLLSAKCFNERFSYLLSPKQRIKILTELGRILPDDSLMLGCAEVICVNRMKTAEAVAHARMARDPKKRADPFKLWLAIQATITKYRQRFPDFSNAAVSKVLSFGETFYSSLP